jgi:hypothetical protein
MYPCYSKELIRKNKMLEFKKPTRDPKATHHQTTEIILLTNILPHA